MQENQLQRLQPSTKAAGFIGILEVISTSLGFPGVGTGLGVLISALVDDKSK